MEILKALELTGKARRPEWYRGRFLFVQDGCYYVSGIPYQKYSSIDLSEDSWQPYHEKPEIRPEKVGELWTWCSEYYHTETLGFELIFHGKSPNVNVKKIIHGKDGWIRVRPEVKNERD